MRKPADFNKTPDERQAVQKRGGGQVQIAYFTNWGIYSGYNFRMSEFTYLLDDLQINFDQLFRAYRHCP
jgi:hypothetical protein